MQTCPAQDSENHQKSPRGKACHLWHGLALLAFQRRYGATGSCRHNGRRRSTCLHKKRCASIATPNIRALEHSSCLHRGCRSRRCIGMVKRKQLVVLLSHDDKDQANHRQLAILLDVSDILLFCTTVLAKRITYICFSFWE